MPKPANYPVVDEMHLLAPPWLERITATCLALEQETTAEIAVFVIPSTRGENPHQHGVRIYNEWKVGKARKDNGVLLVFAMDDRHVELIPGKGYNALFTRAVSEDLLTQSVVPLMRRREYGEAILAGVTATAQRIRDHEQGVSDATASRAGLVTQQTAPGYRPPRSRCRGDGRRSRWPLWVTIFLFFCFFLFLLWIGLVLTDPARSGNRGRSNAATDTSSSIWDSGSSFSSSDSGGGSDSGGSFDSGGSSDGGGGGGADW